MNNNIYTEVTKYYSDKIVTYGDSPRGVDWNGEESQMIRFEQIRRVFLHSNNISVNDLGCGYGALYEYLGQYSGADILYTGYDVSKEMIEAATKHFESHSSKNLNFVHLKNTEEMKDAHYIVSSGIFNVKLEFDDEQWYDYIVDTINVMYKKCRYAIAFNCLTSYSDDDKKVDKLFYADPCVMFKYCKENLSKNVTLIHDYELYEFTIIVRKNY